MKLHSVTILSTACLMMLLINMVGASGFSKKVTEKGDCSKGRAERGDSVKVHYRGTLQDGTQFDASYDRGQPLDMVLGQGMVIQCWEKGIEGLCVGEKATLVCPPEMAYGDRGAGNVIPPK